MSTTITLPLFPVMVVRSNDMKVVTQVPQHEIAVLRAVHGDDNIVPMEQEEFPEEIVLDISADKEIGRLSAKYKRINDADRVRQAYPMGAVQLREFGFELNRGQYSKPPASEQIDYAREERIRKGKEKKAAEAEGKKAPAK